MVAAAGRLSVDPRSSLQAKWKSTVRKRSLAERFAWLNSDEGIAAFPGRQRWEKIRYIRDRLLQLASEVPSIDWLNAAENHNADFPVPGMVLARGRVRIGDGNIPTRRFTPPIAVQVEDMLDRMDVLRAAYYHHPPSITGLQMEMIGWRRGREERENPRGKNRRSGNSRNKKRLFTSRVLETTYSNKGLHIVAQ